MPVFHSNEVIGPSRKDEEHLLENIRPEAKPKEREQMYRSVLETVSDGIILQAASGEILIWNKGAEKIFGISAKEALGETSESKDWPTIREDGSKYEGKDHPSMRTLRTGQPCRNEIMGVGQSGGTLRWISINTNPLFRGNEALPYAVAISFSDITDLKREKDLSRTYLDIAGVILMALDTHGDIVSINKKGCEILEASEEALLGKNWFDTCLPGPSVEQTRQVFMELMAGRMASGEYTENKVRTLTGKEKIIAWHNTVMKDDRGRITGTFSSGTDISRRKAAEAALRFERDMSRQVMETSPVGIVRVNTPGRIEYANRRAEKILGIERQALAERTYKDPAWRITDMNGNPVAEENLPFCRVQSTGKPVFDIQHAIHWPDGRRILLSINAAPLFSVEGAFDGMVAALEDITAKVEAEQKYGMLFSEMIEGFAVHEIICDDQGKPVDYRFLDINPAFERITGLQKETLIGRTVLEVMPNIEPYWIETYGKVALTGKPAFFDNYSRELARHFKVTAFRPAANQFACIFMDITESKRLEARLAQAQKMESIGNLAGGIAHDFNNILFPIIGLSEMLVEDLPPGSQELTSASEILKAGMRGTDLVKQILAFSRQSENRKGPVRFQQVLEEVLKLVRSTIPTSIRIEQDIQQDCGMLMADATQLHQIAMNLITNAYHAVEDKDEGGQIAVRLKDVLLEEGHLPAATLLPGRHAQLTVSDTGCGIESDLLEKIFEPYFTTKAQGKGTGLGLAVVFGIVKEHSGEIKVDSEPGMGTHFTIWLPLIETDIRSAMQASQEQLPGGHEHILIVDDETAIVRMETSILERLGYRVTGRSSSTDALEAFKTAPDSFNLVITDMTMPNMTGDRLAKALISIRPDIHIIICTGFSEKIDRDMARAIGVKGYLMKPVVRSELARMVRKVLDEAQEER